MFLLNLSNDFIESLKAEPKMEWLDMKSDIRDELHDGQWVGNWVHTSSRLLLRGLLFRLVRLLLDLDRLVIDEHDELEQDEDDVDCNEFEEEWWWAESAPEWFVLTDADEEVEQWEWDLGV